MEHLATNTQDDGQMLLEVTAVTHQGKVRMHNEDTIVVGDWIGSDSMDAPRQSSHDFTAATLVLVADGMGGHVGGREASQRAAQAMVRLIPGDTGVEPAEVADALRTVNKEVFDAMADDPTLKGMGTTVAGLVVMADQIVWFNVGDSRVYSVRPEFLRQLSVDDVPAWQGEGGSQITQALGGADAYLEIDPHVGSEATRPGRRYLLCSDGLTDVVSLEDIERALIERASIERDLIKRDLIERAFWDADHSFVGKLLDSTLAAGAPDNVSIVLATIRPRNREEQQPAQ